MHIRQDILLPASGQQISIRERGVERNHAAFIRVIREQISFVWQLDNAWHHSNVSSSLQTLHKSILSFLGEWMLF